jgi:hypothetical protein
MPVFIHHSAVDGTYRYIRRNLLHIICLHLGKTGAAHLIVQVQYDGQFKPIYRCKLISEEHPQSSQQGSAPQMENFVQWLSLSEGMSL